MVTWKIFLQSPSFITCLRSASCHTWCNFRILYLYVLIHIFPITINMAPKHKLTTCTSYDVHPKKAELLEWFLNAISLWNETLKSQKSAADNLRPYQEIFVFLAAQKTAATVVNHHVFLEKKNLQKMSLHILTQLNQTQTLCMTHFPSYTPGPSSPVLTSVVSEEKIKAYSSSYNSSYGSCTKNHLNLTVIFIMSWHQNVTPKWDVTPLNT